jgi:hypothetical protein
MKGRTPPPKRGPALEDILAALVGQSGVFMLEYRHDDGCPTIASQDMNDCTCQVVEHDLLRYRPEGGKR